MNLLYPFDRADVKRLVDAGLGKPSNAATPFGVLPALRCSPEVYEAGKRFSSGLSSFSNSTELTDYLLQRFRLRVVR